MKPLEFPGRNNKDSFVSFFLTKTEARQESTIQTNLRFPSNKRLKIPLQGNEQIRAFMDKVRMENLKKDDCRSKIKRSFISYAYPLKS
jgi:hypothetical protein